MTVADCRSCLPHGAPLLTIIYGSFSFTLSPSLRDQPSSHSSHCLVVFISSHITLMFAAPTSISCHTLQSSVAHLFINMITVTGIVIIITQSFSATTPATTHKNYVKYCTNKSTGTRPATYVDGMDG